MKEIINNSILFSAIIRVLLNLAYIREYWLMALRIGMVLDNDFPPDSRVENEAISLIHSGFEVYLFSVSYKKREKEQEINGIKVIRHKASQLTYKLSALAYTFPWYHSILKGRIREFIKKFNIQVLHCHDMQIARAVWDANKMGIPVRLDLHENRPEIMKFYRHVRSFPGRWLISPKVWERYQNQFSKTADAVIVVTRKDKEVSVEKNLANPDNVAVVPNTIHPEIFYKYPTIKHIRERYRDTFNILYLGDTGLRRGTDTALKAMDIIAKKIPDSLLIFVGCNKEDAVLKQMVKDLGLENKVVFEGWQDVSTFPSYIKAADVCISPLKRNKHHDTTFANKVFQYMAMGKPSVVSDCPPQAEVINTSNAGLVHEADNPHDLAEKVTQLYSEKALRLKMGANAREAVNEFWNWEVTSAELVNMYKRIEKEYFQSASDG